MKNKKMRRILALCLATGMVLTACGTSNPKGDVTDVSSPNPVTSEVTSSENSETKEPTVLTVWVQEYAKRDYNECMQTIFLEEKFNVDLVFEYFPSTAKRDTQYALLLAEGKYPDLLLGQFTPEQIREGINSNALLDISDYIVEGTHYYNLLEEHPELDNMMTADDGGKYSFPYVTGDVRNVSEYKMWIRQEWLDALGWEKAPATPEEFKEYLIQVRDKDVNGDGDTTDEIPLMGYYGGRKSDPICFLMNPFELYTEDYYYITDTGEIHFSAVSDGWRKGLAYMADLYKEGLIAEETYIQDEATFKEVLFSNATIGAYTFWNNASYKSKDSVGAPSFFTYEALAPLKGDYQQTAATLDGRPQMRSAISTQCSNPELAFEVLDYMLSEEGSFISVWGPEGDAWEWIDVPSFAGESKSIKQLVDDINQARWNGGDTGCYVTKEMRYATADDESLYEVSTTLNHVKAAGKYEPYYVNHNVPSLVWADEDLSAEVSEYSSLIKEFIQTANTEFIMGRRDINDDGDWQDYVKEIEAMGLEDYIELLYTYYGMK